MARTHPQNPTAFWPSLAVAPVARFPTERRYGDDDQGLADFSIHDRVWKVLWEHTPRMVLVRASDPRHRCGQRGRRFYLRGKALTETLTARVVEDCLILQLFKRLRMELNDLHRRSACRT